MGYVIREERHYEAPIECVWAVLSEHRRMPEWLTPGIKVYVKPEGVPAPNGVGAVRVMRRGGYRGEEKVVVFEPPHRLSYTVIRGFPVAEHLGEMVLESVEGGTKLVWTVTFRPRYFGTGWVLNAIVKRVLSSGLSRLEGVLRKETAGLGELA